RGPAALRPRPRPLDDTHAGSDAGVGVMPGLLDGKAAIVSGIGPGAGRSIALAFAREGAAVVLAARTVAALESAAAEVRAHGRRALVVPTDVARPEDCRRLADTAQAELGRIDVLVNNAFRSAPYDAVEEASMDDWRKIFDVNVFGSVQLSQAVVPHMKARRSGSIALGHSMSVRIIEARFRGHAPPQAGPPAVAQAVARGGGADRI